MRERSLRQEIKGNLPALLKMMNESRRCGKKFQLIDDTHVSVFDAEDYWLQGAAEWQKDEFFVTVYTTNAFITKYFLKLRRKLFKLRRVEEE